MKIKYAAAVLLSLGLSASAYAQPANFGFETGDTTGWVESFPSVGGNTYFGNIDVVTDWTKGDASYKPVEGKYFAVFETGESSGEAAVLSQVISLKKGGKLEGWATFCCGEEVYYPYAPIDSMNYNDNASIRILNSRGNVVAEPWYADSFDLGYEITTPEGERTGEVVDFGPLPWEHWSWTASKAGNYTLEYYTAQDGDVVGYSYAFFDGPRGESTAVPEPATMAMLGMVLGGVAFTRRFLCECGVFEA